MLNLHLRPRFFDVGLFLSAALISGCSGDSDGSENVPLRPDSEAPSSSPEGGAAPQDGPVPTLPSPTGPCPSFAPGTASFTVGGVARTADLYINETAAAAADGPIVFYWYGTGGRPSQAEQGLGMEGIQRITDAGGIVVAPTHANTGIFPWIQGDVTTDFAFTDEVVGCAEQTIGIDDRRIHALGFSAGALFTAQLSLGRSSYIASVVTYSGGAEGMAQDPNNHFAAMVFHGGPTDIVVLEFEQTSIAYHTMLKSRGSFAVLCNHGGGHRIPGDAVPSAVQFFFDHPYGTTPSPYAAGLPSGVPSYCAP